MHEYLINSLLFISRVWPKGKNVSWVYNQFRSPNLWYWEIQSILHFSTIFDTALAAMISEGHSEDRIKTNQHWTLTILYTLCFGLSQVCNWLQTDNAIFLHQTNLNQHGLDTVRHMGGSCCRRLAGNLLNHLSNSNHQKISEVINDAIQHQWQLVLVIDDFTSIHTRCRPTTD